MNWQDCSKTVTDAAGNTVGQIASLKCLPIAIKNLADFLFLGVGIVAVFFVTIAGFRFVTSAGDPQKVERAKKTLTYALLGLAVVILSYVILKVVTYVTGAGCISTLLVDTCNK